ncbi:uncharacterized protein APUU_40619A [Aspergillus puulaauensis]|uniref:Uncharacterized protein n=1 Tax=Aspergillus puulaauensis TaxID=1220207 RepID=A0A7R8AP28_9EURO|nr:uncharacterized protein APUU_40619A [Aspergillus puulaauensis]BCS24175.1 hypothetical protein APUU_40619A [Aspergillus puulaauensis]
MLGQRITSLILRKPTHEGEASLAGLSLADLRWWLAVEKGLPAFKLSALLRVMPADEFAAITGNRKLLKKKITSMYFKPKDWDRTDVQVWDFPMEKFPGDRAWDREPI